jgi:hypothetical protein
MQDVGWVSEPSEHHSERKVEAARKYAPLIQPLGQMRQVLIHPKQEEHLLAVR